MISKFKQINDGQLQWENGIEKVEVSTSAIQSALVDASKKYVYVISENNEKERFIIQYSMHGKEIRRISPPQGYSFYYLSHHFKASISVVCQGPADEYGRTDYHFGIDLKKGTLKYIGLAY